MSDNPFVGRWTYRSLLNDPDLNKAFNDLEFGRGTLEIAEGLSQVLTGTIGGPGWSLTLRGSRAYGTPMRARFQGCHNQSVMPDRMMQIFWSGQERPDHGKLVDALWVGK